MVTTLGIDQATTMTWGTRAVFAVAVLTTLSAFAKETATVAIDLPKVSGISTTARPAVTPATPIVPAAPVLATKAKKLNPFTQITRGMASWYGKVLDGHRTASGVRFNMLELTAAHRTLPFGTKVKVTNQRNHKSVIVTITDRGVLAADRVIDLSLGAAQKLDMVKSGVDPVSLEVVSAKQAMLADADLVPQF